MNTATVHIPTVREHTEQLTPIIGSGAATELAVSIMAHSRHQARVAATKQAVAALTHAEQILLLTIDCFGLCRYRPKPFRNLGSGRTTTLDWEAYRAAAEEVLYSLTHSEVTLQLLDINVVYIVDRQGDSLGEVFLPDFLLETETEEHLVSLSKQHLLHKLDIKAHQVYWPAKLDGPVEVWAALYHSLVFDSLSGFQTPSQCVGKSLQNLADIHFDHELAALGLSYRAACRDPECPCDGENNSPEHRHGWEFYPSHEDWVHSFVYTYISSKS